LLVKEYEGFRGEAYKCPAGVWTIGYGSTKGVKEGDKITKEEADKLFAKEFAEFAKQVEKLAGKDTSDMKLGAMTSLAYNIGMANFKASSVLKYHLAKDYSKAGACFGLWNKATVNGKKVVLKGLVRRRDTETKLYRGEL